MTNLLESTFWKEYCTKDGIIQEIDTIHENKCALMLPVSVKHSPIIK